MTIVHTVEPHVSSPTLARLSKRLGRERSARKEAERLLEEQSRALFESNRQLASAFVDLKAQADQTQGLLEHLPVSVVVASEDGTIEAVNRLAVRTFGLSPPAIRGMTLWDFLPILADRHLRESEKLADPFIPFQTQAVAAEGRQFDCEVVAARFGKAHDALVIWMIRDITRRLEAERQRSRLEAELLQAQKFESLGTLAGGIAHELNTPIQFVTDNVKFMEGAFQDLASAIDFLGNKTPADELTRATADFDLNYLFSEVPQAIIQTRDGLARIAEIVLAVRRFSHPGGTRKEPDDINEIIRTTVTISKNQWKYIAEMKLDLAPDLPRVNLNAGEISQMFLNLIVNAAHAIEERKGTDVLGNAITISTRSHEDAVECRVSDTGVGICPEHFSRIFDLFFTTKDPGRGTGQGLAIVNTIVTQSHGGKIDVESEPGKGTTFTITLPMAGAGEAQAPTKEQAPAMSISA